MTCRYSLASGTLRTVFHAAHPFVVQGRDRYVVRVYYHVLVLLVEDVAVQDVIIASLFLKEVSVHVYMLIVWIDSFEAATPLVLQHRLFNHRIVRTFCFR